MSVIQIDTREKENGEVINYFDKIYQKYFVSKLYSGDYLDINSGNVVIDLKADLVELANNLTKQHDRFKREIKRAKSEMDCRFVVLIREDLKSLEDVKEWQSPKRKNGKPLTQVKGETLYAIMKTMQIRYGVEWHFCNRDDAGKKILEILQIK